MNKLKFYKGVKEKYNLSTHGTGIFFATDTSEIIHNGIAYGVQEGYATQNFVLEALKNFPNTAIYKTESNEIIFQNSNSGQIIYSITIPIATKDNDGLLSKEDKQKLDLLEEVVWYSESI